MAADRAGQFRLCLERLCRNDHGFPALHSSSLGPDAYGWTGCNGRAVALSIALGDELSKAVRGLPESNLALPFSDPAPIAAHGLLRRLAPLMLMVYRRRDARKSPDARRRIGVIGRLPPRPASM